jgi:hypothetical protein
MPQVEFFAVRDDLIELFSRLFANTDIQIFEMYSECDQYLRRFRSTEEILTALPIGQDKYGNGKHYLLSLWSPSVTFEPEVKRVNFNGKVEGHTHRFTVQGRGLMQLYLGGVFENTITNSYFGHFSEKGAAKWGPVDGINWSASRKLSNKVQYLLREKLRAARAPGMPVLDGALEMHKQGYVFKAGGHVYNLIESAVPAVQANALMRYNQPL